MRRLYLLVSIAFSGCSSCDDPNVRIVDVVQPDTPPICNPLSQAGCNAGEKCTWLLDALMPQYVGHVGCAVDGAAGVGDACMYGAPGAQGYDNCAKGLVCGNYAGGAGTCKTVCDPQGGNPTCGATHVCVTYAGLFSTGATTPPSGGVCDLACDPLADNDYDGSGSALGRTGTTCGSALTSGCYGYPSFGRAPGTGWSCGGDVNAAVAQPTGLRHRVQCTEANGCADPGPTLYVNSCNQGYIPLLRESVTVSTAICVAICKPMNCFMGNCGSNNDNRLGAAPHRCNPIDRIGTFAIGQAEEHCQYLWVREIDQMGNFLRSATSDTVGFCYDHSKYQYDSDGNNMPDTPLPACATLPDGFGSGSAFGAADLGCVDTSHAPNLATGKPKRTAFDDLRPLFTRHVRSH
jgi:hypothetical protein